MATRRKIELREERVEVRAEFLEGGSILAGTKNGRCERFEIDLILNSERGAEEIGELIELAHAMCFTEDVLNREVNVETSHYLNGERLSRP